MQTLTRSTITADHIDEYGHMNHALGLRLLEWARDDWYRQAGLWQGRAWTADEALGTIVLNLNVNYRAECFEGEAVEIVTEPLSLGSKSFVLGHSMRKDDGRVAIDGTCTSLIMDLRQRITLPVPESLARLFPAPAD